MEQQRAALREVIECIKGIIEDPEVLNVWGGHVDQDDLDRWQAALAQPAGEPTTAEQKLAKAGVFKGATGLRKLSQAREFWEKQPYGTRLYYGPQADDYLHRGVLEAAVRIMDAQPQPATPESKA